jgi:hypothetical protein
MSTNISQIISDAQDDFEGGKSFDINWNSLLRRAAIALLKKIKPESLKRVAPIYGGLTTFLQVYYCPSDMNVPSRIYSYDRSIRFEYVPPAVFYRQGYRNNKFTIESVNGSKFITLRHGLSVGSITLEAFDGTSTTLSSTTTLTRNTFNVLPGSTYSLQGSFPSGASTISDTYATPIDISSYLYGVAILPLFCDTAKNIASIVLSLTDINGNGYSVNSTMDSVGDYLHDGQNMVRFWLQHATITGSPVSTAITNMSLVITLASGTTQTIVLGKLTVQQSQLFFFEYYSNQMFIDKTTGAWKGTPAIGDLANVDEDTYDCLLGELEELVIKGNAVDRVDAGEDGRVQTLLANSYGAYWSNHPSSEKPLTYSIMPEIGLHPAIYGTTWDEDDELGDQIGTYSNAPNFLGIVYFADNEVPMGTIDGTNTVFTLAHAPDPAASLLLILNATVLTQGVDYTLIGKTITFTTAPNALYSTYPFRASYRYTAI